MTSKHDRRGSAFLMALLGVLVLAIVGIGLAYFASTEDRISSADKLQKEGFYAAEMGLRVGESALGPAMQSTGANTTLLTTTPLGTTYSPQPSASSPTSLDLHDGGYVAVALTTGAAGAGQTYLDVPVTFAGVSPTDQPYYSLYIRNNREDTTGSASSDGDMRLNLISVGYIDLPGGKRITKIVEEQVSAVNLGPEGALQKQGNSGGTGGI